MLTKTLMRLWQRLLYAVVPYNNDLKCKSTADNCRICRSEMNSLRLIYGSLGNKELKVTLSNIQFMERNTV